MRKAKRDLIPRAGAEHSATVYGRKLGNRARAVLDQAWDRLLSGDVKDKHGRDFVTALAQEMVEAPISAVERTLRACPDEAPGDGRPLNVGQLFLQAVMQANKPPATPGDDARVIEGAATEAAPEADW
jgi:hypothetical protein